MNALVLWVIAGAILVFLAGLIGRRASYIEVDDAGHEYPVTNQWLGILIDDRKRYSLTHFQIVVWSLVLLSLIGAVFAFRLLARTNPGEPLNFQIPTNLLLLAGISGGSAVAATAVKSTKDTPAIQAKSGRTRFTQIFMVEEGSATDSAVDVTKFQNFFLTVIAVLAYLVLAGSFLAGYSLSQANPPVPDHLPDLAQGLILLIGISHSAYVGGKIPNKS